MERRTEERNKVKKTQRIKKGRNERRIFKNKQTTTTKMNERKKKERGMKEEIIKVIVLENIFFFI